MTQVTPKGNRSGARSLPSRGHPVWIDAGRFRSLWDFTTSVSDGLHSFSAAIATGEAPTVIWDLKKVVAGRQDIAALTTFLAVALRVRDWLGTSAKADAVWDPRVLGFWQDMRLIELIAQHDLLTWPFALGGYDYDKMNPNSRLMVLERPTYLDGFDPYLAREQELEEVKRQLREDAANKVELACLALFDSTVRGRSVRQTLRSAAGRLAGELAANAHLWGATLAVVGTQIRHHRVTLAVSDVGVGLTRSLNRKALFGGVRVSDSVDALIAASFFNRKQFGLLRVIDEVTRDGGRVEVASGAAFINWDQHLWRHCVANDILSWPISDARQEIRQFMNRGVGAGYVREVDGGLRGLRVVLHIKIQAGDRNVRLG